MEYTRPRAKLVTSLGVLELPRWEDVWLAEVCLRIPSQLAKQNGKFPETLLFNTRTRPCPLAYSRKGIIRSSCTWRTEFQHHSHRPATIWL
ncbi:hypothetical protein LWI29_001532 [Acer saccharum]|uniref:Uncharacterized protein n=1 Tax=Acer saccharum TaxID=4024 RepID=A0AA39SAU2_ACESA|nr:hypothetical protein LWI29_001532 [Acer saccharum]